MFDYIERSYCFNHALSSMATTAMDKSVSVETSRVYHYHFGRNTYNTYAYVSSLRCIWWLPAVALAMPCPLERVVVTERGLSCGQSQA